MTPSHHRRSQLRDLRVKCTHYYHSAIEHDQLLSFLMYETPLHDGRSRKPNGHDHSHNIFPLHTTFSQAILSNAFTRHSTELSYSSILGHVFASRPNNKECGFSAFPREPQLSIYFHDHQRHEYRLGPFRPLFFFLV